ncbi:hypothetical protein N9937_00440 [bacterium]|nr:hypothetical protein [bacterium]
MKGFLLSEQTNDLIIENGDLQMSTSIAQNLRQRIYVKLNAWMGEWKLNINFGVPYRQEIFVGGVTKEGVDTIFRSKILEYSDVISITEFRSELDSTNRRYSITSLVIKTNDGPTDIINSFAPDNIEYQPSPISDAGNLCGTVTPDLTNRFHQFLHFDLVGLWS